jgi:hypothetical protein
MSQAPDGLALENARTLARAPIDDVHVDVEHTPLHFDALRMFHIGMTDRAAIVKRGNLQPDVALLAAFRRTRLGGEAGA